MTSLHALPKRRPLAAPSSSCLDTWSPSTTSSGEVTLVVVVAAMSLHNNEVWNLLERYKKIPLQNRVIQIPSHHYYTNSHWPGPRRPMGYCVGIWLSRFFTVISKDPGSSPKGSVNIGGNMSWHNYVAAIAKADSQNLCALFSSMSRRVISKRRSRIDDKLRRPRSSKADSWQATKIKIDPATLPTFVSSSQIFKVKDQDTVVLPCEVANPGPYVLVWKRGIAVLSAGKTLVSPDPRVTLNPDYSLEIKEVGPQDAGDYICQIGTLEPREITHTVEILVPPRIHYVTSNGRVEVKKGSTVRLECKASGNPVPKVTWSRKNNLLPGGDQSVTTPVLTLDKVDRHQAGIYQCVAGNGVGEDVKEQIFLHVLYPPEITVERPVVYSGEGMEAQLVCIVHGESQPEVLWYRDTMQLDTTERRIMESRGSRHTLVIRKVNRQDFGNYTCVADNQLGKTRKSIQLTGKPHPAKFNSPTTGKWKENYNISWEVESLSPVEEYKLLYRRLPDIISVTGDNQPQPLHHQSLKKVFPRGDNKTFPANGYVYTRPIKDRRLDWRDVILPAIPAQPVGMQSMSYVIRGLEPGQQYEARVQARNKFGWSPVSDAFNFKTTDTENAIEDVQSVRSYSSDAISHMRANVSILLIVFKIFVRLISYT